MSQQPLEPLSRAPIARLLGCTHGCTLGLARWLPALCLALFASLAFASPARAQDSTRADELTEQGGYFFSSGYYFRAADSYRLALLEDPTNASRMLDFGHSLFATGQYGYASYALRKGVSHSSPKATFEAEVAGLFPSRRRFQQALRDLKRYVTYSPRDPAGLTVLGYVLYTIPGEERRCRDLFRYLLKIDGEDAFARFFLKQLTQRKGPKKAVAGVARPVALILRRFTGDELEKLQSALRVHPGVKKLVQDEETSTFVRLRFDYSGKDRVESALRNVVDSLGFRHEFKEIKTSKLPALTFLIAMTSKDATEPAPKPTEAPEPVRTKGLREKLPKTKTPRADLENEWPAPAPARSR